MRGCTSSALNGTDHRTHAEQDTAIGAYIRWRNHRAQPKSGFAIPVRRPGRNPPGATSPIARAVRRGRYKPDDADDSPRHATDAGLGPD
ncbi:hypothetical protein [Micromonospora sp. IBHARD004]|uniref:hypothetical protein n=1 Tax=Micromonospora sp. IBHARD004 TaxID=3457764 RepID=UPI00405863D5